MWTDVFGAWAALVCRTYHSVFGYFPNACLVNAGYPALVAAAVLAVVLLIAITVVWRRLRARR